MLCVPAPVLRGVRDPVTLLPTLTGEDEVVPPTGTQDDGDIYQRLWAEKTSPQVSCGLG